MRWSTQVFGRAVIAGMVVALLPLTVVAHERKALGGDGGPGDERYIVDIGFRNEPVTVDQPNAIWVWVTETGDAGGPVTGLEASLNVEVEHGGQTVPLALEPQDDPGFYEAPFRPTEGGDYGIRLFGTIEQLPVDETFSPDVIDSSWLEPPAAADTSQTPADTSQAPTDTSRARRGAQLIEEANLRAAHSQRLAYIGIALGSVGLLVGLLALARSGRPGAGSPR